MLILNSIGMSTQTEVTAKSGATSRIIMFVAIIIAIMIATAGCSSPAAPSVSDIRAEYQCSYSLRTVSDTTLEEIASREMPSDLYTPEWYSLSPSGEVDARISWIQAVRALNGMSGEIPADTTLEFPAMCLREGQ